jgi:hypothetical protein
MNLTAACRSSSRVLLLLASATLLAAPLSTAWAAPAAKSSAEATYRFEREKCLSGRSHQDRATCLKEAGAALAEARRNRLDNGASAAQLAANRIARCQAQPEADRADCERMARGEGTVAGTVEGGGVIRELVTRQVGTPTRTN